MARYDVYRLRGSDALVLDVQADFLNHLHTRVVVPLLIDAEIEFTRMNPKMVVREREHVLVPAYMTSVQILEIEETVANLSQEHDKIVAVLDFLFQGF